jgi:hypothetical protein
LLTRRFTAWRKPHQQPSIGVLLRATKNHEVVEYALSRSVSPALVSPYQTRLPDKRLLQAKLHEFYALAGRHGFGQGCLHARRLVEAGVPFVEVYLENWTRTRSASPTGRWN